MAQAYALEDPGEGINEVEIIDIHVAKGDHIHDGDILVSVETDKAANDIPAPFDGTIESVEVKEGDKVKVGTTLVKYSSDAEDKDEEQEQDGAEAKGKAEEKDQDKKARKEEEADAQEDKAAKGKDKNDQKDTAKAKESEDQSGQATTEDQEERTQQRPSETGKKQHSAKGEELQKSEQSKQTAHPQQDPNRPVPSAPSTRRLAHEMDVDLHEVEPSGPDGRVTKEDVEAFAGEAPQQQKSQAEGDESTTAADERGTGHQTAPALPDFSQWGKVERQPLRSVRRTVAEQMALSWEQIPHVMHQSVADITDLERFRQRHKEDEEAQGGKLTLTVLVLKAAVAALKQFPRFNASVDMEQEEIILKQHYHIGIAVATERGLLVPVIRDVDRKSISELAVETATLAEQARQGELSRQDMEGGTFSLTNPGPIGATSFSPIIRYPEAAILGMCSSSLEPVARGTVDDYQVEARLRLPLCLAYDHRLNDGADAAQFLKTIVDSLQDPESLLLAV